MVRYHLVFRYSFGRGSWPGIFTARESGKIRFFRFLFEPTPLSRNFLAAKELKPTEQAALS